MKNFSERVNALFNFSSDQELYHLIKRLNDTDKLIALVYLLSLGYDGDIIDTFMPSKYLDKIDDYRSEGKLTMSKLLDIINVSKSTYKLKNKVFKDIDKIISKDSELTGMQVLNDI